jgi:hypothetical protein
MQNIDRWMVGWSCDQKRRAPQPGSRQEIKWRGGAAVKRNVRHTCDQIELRLNCSIKVKNGDELAPTMGRDNGISRSAVPCDDVETKQPCSRQGKQTRQQGRQSWLQQANLQRIQRPSGKEPLDRCDETVERRYREHRMREECFAQLLIPSYICPLSTKETRQDLKCVESEAKLDASSRVQLQQ